VTDPLDADATGQAAMIAEGRISPAELLDATIRRAEAVNPGINALVTETFADARERARKGALPQGPMRGVPYAIKDLSATAGVRTTMGSRAMLGNVPTDDDVTVRVLRGAGVNLIGKTNTPEFGLISSTESLALGPCHNPWDREYSPGGSSGGAAAAVAAGILAAADASDGGGSIRVPAACCGLVGLKPSRGRITGSQDETDVLKIAVKLAVTRSVRDTAALLAIYQGPQGLAGLAPLGVVMPNPGRRLRVAVSTRSAKGTDPVPDVVDAVQKAAQLCETLGHTVTEAAPQYDGLAFEDRFIDLWSSGAVDVRQLLLSRGVPEASLHEFLEPWTLWLADRARIAPAGTHQRVREQFLHVQSMVNQFMQNFDVWLTPVVSAPAPKLGEQGPQVAPPVLYKRVLDWAAYTPLANAIGTPAISLPLGMSGSGLPIGCMFMGRWGDEQTLLELAYQLEEAAPWFDRRPAVST
jgi:amidase